MHHENGRGNYGLWFTWWDRCCGTEQAHYLARFDAVTAARPEGDTEHALHSAA